AAVGGRPCLAGVCLAGLARRAGREAVLGQAIMNVLADDARLVIELALDSGRRRGEAQPEQQRRRQVGLAHDLLHYLAGSLLARAAGGGRAQHDLEDSTWSVNGDALGDFASY